MERGVFRMGQSDRFFSAFCEMLTTHFFILYCTLANYMNHRMAPSSTFRKW